MLYPETIKYNMTGNRLNNAKPCSPFHSSHKDFTDYRIVTKKADCLNFSKTSLYKPNTPLKYPPPQIIITLCTVHTDSSFELIPNSSLK